MNKGVIKKVTGPLVTAEGVRDANMFDAVHVSDQRLIGKIIETHGDKALVQVYEKTSGLGPGEPAESTGMPMSVELGLGLIGSIYDGIQRPLDAVIEKTGGNLLSHGVEVSSPKREKKRTFEPTVAQGDKVGGGDIIGTVQETDVVAQKIMILVGIQGALTYIGGGELTVTGTVAVVTGEKGQEHPVTLTQKWSARKGCPYQRKLSPDMPLVTGQRVIDYLFPIAKGGAVAVPGPFGSGKTVVQHQLAKWADADTVVYVGRGERGDEMTDVPNEFPELKDSKTGKSLTERIVLIVNTSDMLAAAREVSIYTGIIITEHFRDVGYSVALTTDLISRWAEAPREMSGRLEEMLGEEGYPAYLGPRLTQFYERAGRVISLDSDNREGALSVIDVVSPAGGDIPKSVIQATLRIVKVFWFLDIDLAHKRHFPAVNWPTSYSPYVDTMEKWFNAEVESGWTELRSRLMRLLQEESELNKIVQLVGMDASSAPDRLKLEAARSIREDLLYQNAFHEIDTFAPLKKQHMMMKPMMAYYDQSQDAPDKGVNIERLVSLPVREAIGHFKHIEEPGLDKAYANVIKTLEDEINDELSREEDF